MDRMIGNVIIAVTPGTDRRQAKVAAAVEFIVEEVRKSSLQYFLITTMKSQ
jgi:hypothetical protein